MAINSNITKEIALRISGSVSVGGSPNNTVDSAVKKAAQNFCDYHGWQYNETQALSLMDGENVISLGGLDNYICRLYEKLSQANHI